MPSRMRRYSGSERPAWRMNHTGRCSGTLPAAAMSSGASGRVTTDRPTVSVHVGVRVGHPLPSVTPRTLPAMLARGDRETPASFARAVAALAAMRPRTEVVVTETPAPTRLAAFAVALSAEIAVGEDDLATGRLVLLHDPAGQDAWDGTFRFVAYLRAAVESEMASEPLLCEVAWSWLTEALDDRGAAFTAASGTVTRTASQGFGSMSDDPARSEVEIRASWTPLAPTRPGGPRAGSAAPEAGSDADAHALAWTDLLAMAAGLPPASPALVPFPVGGGRGTRLLRSR